MELELLVITLRYSSWSMRPFLALAHAGADFRTTTVDLNLAKQTVVGGAMVAQQVDLGARRALGSVTGLFPVLRVDGEPIHEALAICELVAERFPEAGLWPDDSLVRARARAVSAEMASGFPHLRNHLSCHPFARVPGFVPPPEAQRDIARVFEIWEEALARSGGPFLFGRFSVADCMYFPVITRFRTYGVALPPSLEAYAQRVEALPAVAAWRELAVHAPRMPVYDEAIRALGGDPDAAV